jgi:uncharacterized membrane protein (DUF106 family)
MATLNAGLRALFDLLQTPFRGLPPLVGLVVWSVVTAVAMLLVFKRTSNQAELEEVKRRIHACLFEIRLFNDDLRAILSAQVEIMRHNLGYLRLSLKPMLWMIVPFVLVIAQLQYHYGYRPLHPGDEVLLTVELDDGWAERLGLGDAAARPPLEVRLPDGLELTSPGVWAPSLDEISWRLTARDWGEYELGLELGGDTELKSVSVSRALERVSPVRPSPDFVSQLTWPAEAPLPADSAIRSISLDYPEATIGAFGWELKWEYGWMVIFFVLSIVFAFALRKPFKVTI